MDVRRVKQNVKVIVKTQQCVKLLFYCGNMFQFY